MDDQSFDTLTRSVSKPSSRRGLLGSFTALALGLAGVAMPDTTSARNKRKHKRKSKKKKSSTPVAACPSGTEDCQGKCMALCPGGQVRNPLTCACCTLNMVSCSAVGPNDDCCSGTCSPVSAVVNTCAGRVIAAPCDFDAQCASGYCSPAGLCLFAAS